MCMTFIYLIHAYNFNYDIVFIKNIYLKIFFLFICYFFYFIIIMHIIQKLYHSCKCGMDDKIFFKNMNNIKNRIGVNHHI